ncbi:MAG TPA: 3-phosphoshikimate 1-carboxyvinyltransferase [Spirochaetia bacterium]|nr:3-phosphoshikimate 1-carboxyvinyltransferase [Spirochaetia bacterium]
MTLVVRPGGTVVGRTTVPGDKSVSHRAAMLGALAEGETVIENFLGGQDCLSTLGCLRALGVAVGGPLSGVVRVTGCGLDGLQEPQDVLDAGNSGTTMRLLLGILAGQPFFSVITGDASLRSRPMARVIGPLTSMGARIAGRAGDSRAPLAVSGGGLSSSSLAIPTASAQVKSAILLAGLFADGVTTVTEPSPSRDHTERLLRAFGGTVEKEGCRVAVAGRPSLQGQRIRVPGDISSAAFLLVAAAILPGSELTVDNVGLNPTRSGVLEVLAAMGAGVTIEGRREECGEPVGSVRIRGGPLSGTVIGGDLIPRLIDEIPVLAVAAACARGTTVIRDAAELKVKESDRIATVVRLLSRMGADITATADGMVINGGLPLAGAVLESFSDHRLAMAAAVAGLVARGETVIPGEKVIDVSFPGFVDLLDSLRER